jgi:Raf kinase inhibitor-like YbhB/YbcL family protein
MRTAYALLGLGMIVLFGAAYAVTKQAEAPSHGTISTKSTASMAFTLSSSAFKNSEAIPSMFTCDGINTSPELRIDGAPQNTASFALIVEDPDIPEAIQQNMGIDVFDHYVLYDIPADTTMIPEGNTTVGTVGKNTRSEGYVGPCPPKEYEPNEHRYVFQLYALDTVLGLPAGATKAELKAAMEGHIIESSFLLGRYKRI